jgi:FkbM family methyltransferase
MASASGWLAQLGPRLRAVRGGLHPVSALKIATRRHDDVRLRGVTLTGPDPRAVANTAVEVAAGEYGATGFEIAAGERVVDAGANVGAFAVLAVTAGASVTAYEPHPDTFAALEHNVAGLDVTCVRAALVARAPGGGTVLLETGGDADTHHRVGTAGLEVPATTLAEAIGAGCDLLKIDCEGAEFELLAGTDGDVLRRARRIACETHAWAGDPGAARDRLAALGYEVTLSPKGDELALLLARRR